MYLLLIGRQFVPQESVFNSKHDNNNFTGFIEVVRKSNM